MTDQNELSDEVDAPAQLAQTRMEQFKEDYSEISNFLRNICTINQALETRYSALTDLVNDITPESQVRRDLRMAIAEIADLQERNEFNSEKVQS